MSEPNVRIDPDKRLSYVKLTNARGFSVHIKPLCIDVIEFTPQEAEWDLTRLTLRNGEVLKVRGYHMDILEQVEGCL